MKTKFKAASLALVVTGTYAAFLTVAWWYYYAWRVLDAGGSIGIRI